MVVGANGDVLVSCRCGKFLTGLRPRRLARLLLALVNLGGGGAVSRVTLGRSRLVVVDRGSFLVALIPHAGSSPILDVEALHIAHILNLLYPELEQCAAAPGSPCEKNIDYSVRGELTANVEAELDNDTATAPPYDRFELQYLDGALARPPECAEWLSALVGCPGVLEAALIEPASGATLLSTRPAAPPTTPTQLALAADDIGRVWPAVFAHAGALASSAASRRTALSGEGFSASAIHLTENGDEPSGWKVSMGESGFMRSDGSNAPATVVLDDLGVAGLRALLQHVPARPSGTALCIACLLLSADAQSDEEHRGADTSLPRSAARALRSAMDSAERAEGAAAEQGAPRALPPGCESAMLRALELIERAFPIAFPEMAHWAGALRQSAPITGRKPHKPSGPAPKSGPRGRALGNPAPATSTATRPEPSNQPLHNLIISGDEMGAPIAPKRPRRPHSGRSAATFERPHLQRSAAPPDAGGTEGPDLGGSVAADPAASGLSPGGGGALGLSQTAAASSVGGAGLGASRLGASSVVRSSQLWQDLDMATPRKEENPAAVARGGAGADAPWHLFEASPLKGAATPTPRGWRQEGGPQPTRLALSPTEEGGAGAEQSPVGAASPGDLARGLLTMHDLGVGGDEGGGQGGQGGLAPVVSPATGLAGSLGGVALDP